MPKIMSFDEAACCPTVFITTTLMTRAALVAPHSRILIHGAAGGVGLAAIQQVQALNAIPVVTAGTSSKRQLLRQLGVQQAASSRDLSFVPELAASGGVSAVLNSLTSPGMVAGSLAGVGVGGSWVEIGKRDIWSPARVAQDRPDVHYTLLALDFLPKQAIQSCLMELSGALSAGKLKPLPLSVHSMRSTQAAMRQMVQAKHVGKVIVTAENPTTTSDSHTGLIAITGGTGALGSAVCRWLIHQQQQQHVVLLGRTGKATSNLVKLLQSQSTAEVTITQCDAASAADVTLLQQQQSSLAALFHIGGVLADASIARQTPAHCRAVFAPKANAMLQLQKLAKSQPVQSFVAISSVAGLLGSPGQANYSAANAYLDAAAASMQSQGLNTVSMQYGAWQGGGMAGSTADKQQALGVGALTPDQGLRALQGVLAGAHNCPGSGANFAATPFDWPVFMGRLNKPSGLFAEFADSTAGVATPQQTPKAPTLIGVITPTAPQEVAQTGPGSPQAGAATVAELRAEISAAVQDILSTAVSPSQPLMAAGLDSLSTVELTSALQTRLRMQLPSTLVFDYPTINAIAEFAHTQLPSSPDQTTDSTALIPLPRAVTVPSSGSSSAAVAITAISARLPAPPTAAKWAAGFNHANVADCSRVVPGDRWSADLQLTADMPARFGMFVEEAYMFDAEAFASTEAEATLLDPQQRLLLETTHEVSTAPYLSEHWTKLMGHCTIPGYNYKSLMGRHLHACMLVATRWTK